MTHSFRIRELCVSYHMGQGNSKLLTPRGPGSRTSPCRRASRLVEVQLSSNTSRYQQERGGGRGLRSERPLEHPSRLIRVESPRDSPVAQEPGTVRRSLCSPGEGRPCADAEDLGVEAEGGRLRRTRGEKTSKVRYSRNDAFPELLRLLRPSRAQGGEMETGRAGRGASSDDLRTDEVGRRAPTPPGSPGDAMVCQHHSHSNFQKPLRPRCRLAMIRPTKLLFSS